MVENRLNIQSEAFLDILKEEERLLKLKDRFPINSQAWHNVWNKIDLIRKRKEAYEQAVEERRKKDKQHE